MMRCLIYNVNRGRGLNKLRSIHKVLSKPTVPTGSSQSPPCHPPEHMFPWKQMPGALKGNFSCDWICRMKPPNAYEGSSRNAGFWELLLAGSGARPWGAVASGAGALNESGDELNSTMMCLHPWERLRACSYSLLVVYGLACTETFDYGSRGTSLLLSPLSQGWVHTVSTCIIHLAQGTIAEVTMSLILPSVHLPISRFHCRRALPCPTKSLWALASDRPGLKLQLFHLRIGRELLGESYSRVGGWRLEGGGPFWARVITPSRDIPLRTLSCPSLSGHLPSRLCLSHNAWNPWNLPLPVNQVDRDVTIRSLGLRSFPKSYWRPALPMGQHPCSHSPLFWCTKYFCSASLQGSASGRQGLLLGLLMCLNGFSVSVMSL